MTTKTTATILSFPPHHSPQTITPNFPQEAMTQAVKAANRFDYECEVIECQSLLLVRPHPAEAAELRAFMGNGKYIKIPVPPDSLRQIAVEAPRLALTKSVLA